MNLTEQIHDALPEVEPFALEEIYAEASEEYYSNGFHKIIEDNFPNLPRNFGSYLLGVYPEKIIDRDTRIPEIMNRVSERLALKRSEPVVVINEHKASSRFHAEDWRHISFGFSLGSETDDHLHFYEPSHIGWGALRPVLFAPQTMAHYDDIGIDFTTSFGVQSFEPSPLNHIGAYLLDRKVDWDSHNSNIDTNVYKIEDDFGQLVIGNAEIQDYIEEHPDHAAVIDGCRDAYRNRGINPEMGRTIAKAFGLDQKLTDTEQTKLSWF